MQSFLFHAHTHRTVTAKVAGKYQDVKTLEQSVAELHQMFLDFALLVEQQGELLNNIEHQVRQAADHVEEANKDVYQSIEIQKSIRKKQMYVIITLGPSPRRLSKILLCTAWTYNYYFMLLHLVYYCTVGSSSLWLSFLLLFCLLRELSSSRLRGYKLSFMCLFPPLVPKPRLSLVSQV
jgi:hypothetical protein